MSRCRQARDARRTLRHVAVMSGFRYILARAQVADTTVNGGSLPQVERCTASMRVRDAASMQSAAHALQKMIALVCAASGRMTEAMKWSSFAKAFRSSSDEAKEPLSRRIPASARRLISAPIALVA